MAAQAAEIPSSHDIDDDRKEILREIIRDTLNGRNTEITKTRGTVKSLCKDHVKYDPTDPGVIEAARDLALGALLAFNWFRGETGLGETFNPSNRDKQRLLSVALSLEAAAKVLGVDLERAGVGYHGMVEHTNKDPEFCEWIVEDAGRRRVRMAESFQTERQQHAPVGGRGAAQ